MYLKSKVNQPQPNKTTQQFCPINLICTSVKKITRHVLKKNKVNQPQPNKTTQQFCPINLLCTSVKKTINQF